MSVELTKVPDAMFNNVVKIREIANAVLYNKATMAEIGKDPTDGDVLIKGMDGSNKLINRVEFINKYRNVNGAKIKMAGLHYNKQYTLLNQSKEPMAMLKVPKNSKHVITVGGKPIPKGVAVVCEIKDGVIDKTNPIFYSPSIFVRMFIVAKKADYLAAKKEISNLQTTAKLTKEREERKNYKAWTEQEKAKKIDIELEKAKIIAVGRIVTSKGQICGFLLNNGKQTKPFNIAQTKELCRNKKIKNLVIVLNQDGTKEYLRGNGIKIENLPARQFQ